MDTCGSPSPTELLTDCLELIQQKREKADQLRLSSSRADQELEALQIALAAGIRGGQISAGDLWSNLVLAGTYQLDQSLVARLRRFGDWLASNAGKCVILM